MLTAWNCNPGTFLASTEAHVDVLQHLFLRHVRLTLPNWSLWNFLLQLCWCVWVCFFAGVQSWGIGVIGDCHTRQTTLVWAQWNCHWLHHTANIQQDHSAHWWIRH